jgi:hypothetical protein
MTDEVNGGTPALNKALAAVQKELPKITAGQTADAGSYKYKYADLADINPEIMPLLGKNGLAWVTRPTWEDGQFVLRYELRHESGQMLDGVYPLHFAGGPQAVGKEITYARRYALCAVTGIATGGDDDDGQSAQKAVHEMPAQAQRGKARAAERRAPDVDAQRRKYHAMRAQLGWSEERGHDFIAELSAGRFQRWSDLDERGRSIVLDAMGEQIRALPTDEPEDGPMFPDPTSPDPRIDPNTGEVER